MKTGRSLQPNRGTVPAQVADMNALRIIVCLLAATACAQKSSLAPSINRQVVLAVGEASPVSDARLVVRFDGVAADSRCPADAMCVVAGDATVRLQVSPSGSDKGTVRTYELHTGNMRPVQHDDITIELVELSPYPFSAHPIDPGEYRVTLRLTR